MTDSTTHTITSDFVSVKIDVEPKRVLHTSPVKFDDAENIFIKR